MSEVRLRLAGPADVQGVTDCVCAAYGEYVPRMGKAPAPMLADYEALIAAGEVHVLTSGDRVVALIVMAARDDHVFVDNVAVHPRWQGRGLGRRLMRLAENTARSEGLRAVRLYSNVVMTRSIAFYRRLGFVETARRREHGYERVYLAKALAGD